MIPAHNVFSVNTKLIMITALLLGAQTVLSQTTADLSGRWESLSPDPDIPSTVIIDIAKDGSGSFHGTLSQPAENINGLPLIDVQLDGRTVLIIAREDQPLRGQLSEDGQSIDGVMDTFNFQIPLLLTRTGPALIDPPVRNPMVNKKFEGRWNGNLGGSALTLKISNNADSTSTAEIVNESQGGLRVPAANVTADELHLVLELKAVGGSFDGEINAEGTEIIGNYVQGNAKSPLTFRRMN